MRLKYIAVFAVAGAFAALSTLAFGANPHFTKSGAPTCTVTNGQVTCSAQMAGLGNEDIVVNLDVAGEATFLCVQPGQKKRDDPNISPGANKVPFSGSATQTIPGASVKNGRATIGPITSPSQEPTATAEQAGCPSGNWGTQLDTATVTTVTISATQGGETLFSCTASGTFTEGTIPLDC